MRGLDDMAVFERIVRDGSLSAAARALGMPKSTVSDRLARLERRLGVRLLERTTRRMELTEPGRDYYGHCQRIVALANEATRAVDRPGPELHGRLRLSAPPILIPGLLAPLVLEAMQRWPALDIELLAVDRPVDPTREGFDLSLELGPRRFGDDLLRPLTDIPLLCVASPGYLQRHGHPSSPAELIEHRCVTASPVERWKFVDPDEAVELRGALVCNTIELAEAAALDDLAIARLPELSARPLLASGALVQLFAPRWAGSRTLCARFPQPHARPPRLRALLELLGDHLARSS